MANTTPSCYLFSTSLSRPRMIRRTWEARLVWRILRPQPQQGQGHPMCLQLSQVPVLMARNLGGWSHSLASLGSLQWSPKALWGVMAQNPISSQSLWIWLIVAMMNPVLLQQKPMLDQIAYHKVRLDINRLLRFFGMQNDVVWRKAHPRLKSQLFLKLIQRDLKSLIILMSCLSQLLACFSHPFFIDEHVCVWLVRMVSPKYI